MSFTALTAGGDGHVAADEERQPAEHLLLGEASLAADQFPDAIGQRLVVGHAR